jgi:hypothetical protein
MWRTPLLVIFTMVIALLAQGMTLRAQAGPRPWPGQPGRRGVTLQPVAILGAKSYRVLPLAWSRRWAWSFHALDSVQAWRWEPSVM